MGLGTGLGAFLWSVGLNVVLAGVFLGSFGRLRVAGGTAERVFTPRAVAAAAAAELSAAPGAAPAALPVLPPTGWAAWLLTARLDTLLEHAGVDATLFVLAFDLGVKVFLGALAVAPMLCGVYVTGSNDRRSDMSTPFDNYISLGNLTAGSLRLWAPLVAAYALTAWTCWLLARAHRKAARLRIAALAGSEPGPEAFTVLVTDIPSQHRLASSASRWYHDVERLVPALTSGVKRLAAGIFTAASIAPEGGGATSPALEEFFARLYPGQALSCRAVPPMRDVHRMRRLRDRLSHRLEHANAVAKERRNLRPSDEVRERLIARQRRGSYSPEVQGVARLLDHAERKLEEARERAATLPSHTAFVSFGKRAVASGAAQHLHYVDAMHWSVQPAPEPRDVIWPNLQLRWWERSIRQLIVAVASFFITFFFLVPVTFVSSLATVDNISKVVPAIGRFAQYHPALKTFVEGYVPGLVLSIFVSIVPLVWMALAYYRGSVAYSQRDRWVIIQQFHVLVLDVFLGSTIAKALMDAITELIKLESLNLKDLVMSLGTYVPSTATFFISFILVKGMAGLTLELSRLRMWLWLAAVLPFCRTEEEKHEAWQPGPVAYAWEVPTAMLMFTLGLVYAPIAPLVVPFTLTFFVVGAIVWRHQLLFVYERQYESMGQMWPLIFHGVCVSLVISHVTLLGLFAIKMGTLQITATLLLPVFVAIFYDHMQRRYGRAFEFLPRDVAARVDDAESALVEDTARLSSMFAPPAMQPGPTSPRGSASYEALEDAL